MYGIGRYDAGLVGDLGLVRLWCALNGGPREEARTHELVEPHGEWAGLASAHLLSHPLARRVRERRVSPPRG